MRNSHNISFVIRFQVGCNILELCKAAHLSVNLPIVKCHSCEIVEHGVQVVCDIRLNIHGAAIKVDALQAQKVRQVLLLSFEGVAVVLWAEDEWGLERAHGG